MSWRISVVRARARVRDRVASARGRRPGGRAPTGRRCAERAWRSLRRRRDGRACPSRGIAVAAAGERDGARLRAPGPRAVAAEVGPLRGAASRARRAPRRPSDCGEQVTAQLDVLLLVDPPITPAASPTGAGGVRLGRARGAPPPARAERLLEVGDQIVGRLDPDRQAHEVARRGERRVGGRRVRHPGRVLDQALDAAEALGELPDPRAARRARPPPPPIARGTRSSRRSRASAARRSRAPGATAGPGRARARRAAGPRGTRRSRARSRSAGACAPRAS